MQSQTVHSKVHFCPASDIIAAVHHILASSRAIMPDLGTSYSRSSFANHNHSAMELNGESIKNIVTERQQQLDEVASEISRLETVMNGIKNLHQHLIEKKNKITESINLHNRLGSALWRLPTEILSEIFVHCLPGTGHLSPTPELAPMLLTVICRQWREVATGMPSFWCKLRLEVDGDWQQKAFCYNSWLKRSRGLPLSLVLKCCERNSTSLVRSLLRPYINEITSLAVFSVCNIDKPELMAADLPALQELTLSTVGCDPMPTTGRSYSPTLRSLTVTGPLFDLEIISSFNPVWSHLTHVHIATRHSNAFLHLLHLCSALSSLTITITLDQIQALGPFTHTKLQALHINTVYTNYLPDLFNALSLPSLRILHLYYLRRWHHEEFKAILTRSNCPLETLIVGPGAMMTAQQRSECVALIPSLQIASYDSD